MSSSQTESLWKSKESYTFKTRGIIHLKHKYRFVAAVSVSEVQHPPEGLTLHVLIRQAVIGERLIPHRVAGVSQGLCAQLVRLLDKG